MCFTGRQSCQHLLNSWLISCDCVCVCLAVNVNVVVNWVITLLFVTSSPDGWLRPRDSTCSPRNSSRRSSIHNRGPAGLQRSLGGVLQATGCILWTDRTGPWPVSHSPARTGWYRESNTRHDL